MSGQSLANKTFRHLQITIFAEVELDGIPVAVNGAVDLHPFSLYPVYIGLVEISFTGNGALSAIKALK